MVGGGGTSGVPFGGQVYERRNGAAASALPHGFSRVRCQGCGDELLVAFSFAGMVEMNLPSREH